MVRTMMGRMNLIHSAHRIVWMLTTPGITKVENNRKTTSKF